MNLFTFFVVFLVRSVKQLSYSLGHIQLNILIYCNDGAGKWPKELVLIQKPPFRDSYLFDWSGIDVYIVYINIYFRRIRTRFFWTS